MAYRPKSKARPTQKRGGVAKTRKKAGPLKKRGPNTKRSTPSEKPYIKWSGLNRAMDSFDRESNRSFKLETLASATDKLLKEDDRIILPTVHKVLGPARIVSLNFTFFEELDYQLIFKLQATNAKRKRALFAFRVAKNAKDFTKLTESEFAVLEKLHQNAPEMVVRPFRGGGIYLPDRYRRQSRGREVFAYLTQWMGGFYELGVARDLQFQVNSRPPHKLGKNQTKALRQQMVEMIAKTYDPKKRTCMEMPRIHCGDLAVTKPQKGRCKLKLSASRKLIEKVSPARMIHLIVSTKWECGKRTLFLCPSDPGSLVEGLVKAVGKKTATQWLSFYKSAVTKGSIPEKKLFSIEVMEELGIE